MSYGTSSINAISTTENPNVPKTSFILPSILLLAMSMFDLVFILIKILFYTSSTKFVPKDLSSTEKRLIRNKQILECKVNLNF
jgi:hypothetical protein